MPPKHVHTLEEYWTWLEGLIVSAGGWFADAVLMVEPAEEDGDRWLSIKVRPQRVMFANGSFLKIAMTVSEDFEVHSYSFHYQDTDGGLIWRKDNVHGGEHIHRPSPRRIAKFEAVDLEEALQEVTEYIETGTRP